MKQFPNLELHFSLGHLDQSFKIFAFTALSSRLLFFGWKIYFLKYIIFNY